MKLLTAIKKYMEEDERIGKLALSELSEFKAALTDADRAEYAAWLSEYFGESVEA